MEEGEKSKYQTSDKKLLDHLANRYEEKKKVVNPNEIIKTEQRLGPTQLGIAYKFPQQKNSFLASRFYGEKKNMSSDQKNSQSLSKTDGYARSHEKEIIRVSKLFQDQNKKLQIATDNVSQSILIYTQHSTTKDKFQDYDYPSTLKKLDKKIFKYRKALEEAIRRQEELMDKNENYEEENNNNNKQQDFDFLTGVGIQKQSIDEENKDQLDKISDRIKEEESQSLLDVQSQKKLEPIQQKNPKNDVQKAFAHVYEQYKNNISKLFLKKDEFPRRQQKKKIPKLYITTRTNSLQKQGQVDTIEHNMRIFNKEHIPSIPKVLIPTFSSKRDNIANSVVAYLKDYKPLIHGQKKLLPIQIQSLLDAELNLLKSIKDENEEISLPLHGFNIENKQENQIQQDQQ